MPFKFNIFTGNLDVVNAPPDQYIDGEVEYHSSLPVTVGTPAVNSAFLVRKGEGLYFISRKPAGIWVRELNNGNLDDWKFAGLFSDLYRDANFRIISDSDTSKELAFSLSGVTSGQTRTLSVPDKSGVVATTSDLPDDYTVVTTAGNLANGDRVAADTTSAAFTLTLPASPANGDTIYVLDYAGTFDTNNLTIGRNGNNIESLAEDLVCNVQKAAFSLVYTGSTVGWKVVPQTAVMPSTQLANTWSVNQTFNGTNNTAPNQTAASGSSVMTRALADARYAIRTVCTYGVSQTAANDGNFFDVTSQGYTHILAVPSKIEIHAEVEFTSAPLAANPANFEFRLSIRNLEGASMNSTLNTDFVDATTVTKISGFERYVIRGEITTFPATWATRITSYGAALLILDAGLWNRTGGSLTLTAQQMRCFYTVFL